MCTAGALGWLVKSSLVKRGACHHHGGHGVNLRPSCMAGDCQVGEDKASNAW